MSTKTAPRYLWPLTACLLLTQLTQLTQLTHAEDAPPDTDPMRACNSGARDFQAPLPGWQWTWENDSFLGPYGTDEFYTQGLQFGYRFRPDRQPAFLSRPMAAI